MGWRDEDYIAKPECFDRSALIQYLVESVKDWDHADLLSYAQDCREDDLSGQSDDDLWMNYRGEYLNAIGDNSLLELEIEMAAKEKEKTDAITEGESAGVQVL